MKHGPQSETIDIGIPNLEKECLRHCIVSLAVLPDVGHKNPLTLNEHLQVQENTDDLPAQHNQYVSDAKNV